MSLSAGIITLAELDLCGELEQCCNFLFLMFVSPLQTVRVSVIITIIIFSLKRLGDEHKITDKNKIYV